MIVGNTIINVEHRSSHVLASDYSNYMCTKLLRDSTYKLNLLTPYLKLDFQDHKRDDHIQHRYFQIHILQNDREYSKSNCFEFWYFLLLKGR